MRYIILPLALILGACATTKTEETMKPSAGLEKCNAEFFSLYFDTGKADLGTEARNTLDQTVRSVMGCDLSYIEIEGHSDTVGSSPANLELSEKRAMAVYDMLVDSDVIADRIRIIPLGEREALADGISNEDDRKTVVRIIP